MDSSVLAAIISGTVALVGSILTFVVAQKSENRKAQESRDKQMQELREEISQSSLKNREDLQKFKEEMRNTMSEIQDCYSESLVGVNSSVAEIKASVQQLSAETNLKLEYMTKEFEEMKVEVREHNGFAKRMPAVEARVDRLESMADWRYKHEG